MGDVLTRRDVATEYLEGLALAYVRGLTAWKNCEIETFAALAKASTGNVSADAGGDHTCEAAELECQGRLKVQRERLSRLREDLRQVAASARTAQAPTADARNVVAAIQQTEEHFELHGGIDADDIDLVTTMRERLIRAS